MHITVEAAPQPQCKADLKGLHKAVVHAEQEFESQGESLTKLR